MMKNIYSLFIIDILALFAAVSCQRETGTPEGARTSRNMAFQVATQPLKSRPETKGIPFGQETDVKKLTFGLAAYTTPASGGESSLYLSPTQIGYDASAGQWLPARDIKWPDRKGTIRFYAYAPFGEAVMDTEAEDLPVLHYSTPEDIAAQHGLLVYTSDPMPDYPEGNNGATVKFTFRHVLSGIIFAVGEGISLESITVSGVYDEGKYHYADDAWTDLKSVRSYRMDHPAMRTIDGFAVTEDRYILLFPPQVCPEGATIHVEADGQSVDIPIGGHQWPEGYVLPYILGRSDYDYHFHADEPEELDWEGGESGDIEIESWREDPEGNVQPVPWIVEGYYATQEDAEAAVNKLEDCFVTAAIAGDPDASGKSALRLTYKAAVPHMEVASLEDGIGAVLAAAAPLGTATSYWNLANPVNGGDAIVESANTYIVSAPGYYRIPLVMGAGVKDGAPVRAAYSESSFKDYKDQPVVSPYLHQSSALAGIPSAAYVIWEDRPLVDVANETSWKVAPMEGGSSAISYYGGCWWLHFHIGPERIAQGLVHLSVTDENDLVMWSYLVWVTLPEADGVSGLAGQNLGWVEKGVSRAAVSDAATAYVRIEQQKIGGKVLVFKLSRAAHEEVSVEHAGYSPYYQFGRKDPLLPGFDGRDVAVIGQHAGFDLTTELEKSTVGASIRSPWAHLSYVSATYDWCADQGRGNWWSGVSKTVYDPCPAGYRMPSYQELMADEAMLSGLLPCGRRNSLGGQLVNVGKYVYYWSSTAVNESSVKIYTDDPEMAAGLGRRSRGLTVRPYRK